MVSSVPIEEEMMDRFSTHIPDENHDEGSDEERLDEQEAALLLWTSRLPDESESQADLALRLGIDESEINSRIDAMLEKLRIRGSES